jgi:protein-tyrosine phosphatase
MSRASMRGGSKRPRIVFVCTGNRFRSPLAAAYLRRLLVGVNVEITTCGTAGVARRNLPPLPEALDVAASSTIAIADHRTRWIRDAELADADLVIGFERSHVAAAVLEGGADRSKTFVLGELVELLRALESSDPQIGQVSLPQLVARAAALRQSPTAAGVHELADPFGGSRRTYERSARDLWRLTIELASLLFPAALPPSALPRPRLRRSLRLGPAR